MNAVADMMYESPIPAHEGDLIFLVAPVHGAVEGRSDAPPTVTTLVRDLLRAGYVVVSAPDMIRRFLRDRQVNWDGWIGAIVHRSDLVMVVCLPGWDDEGSIVRPALRMAQRSDIPVMVVTWSAEGELRMDTFRYGDGAAEPASLSAAS